MKQETDSRNFIRHSKNWSLNLKLAKWKTGRYRYIEKWQWRASAVSGLWLSTCTSFWALRACSTSAISRRFSSSLVADVKLLSSPSGILLQWQNERHSLTLAVTAYGSCILGKTYQDQTKEMPPITPSCCALTYVQKLTILTKTFTCITFKREQN